MAKLLTKEQLPCLLSALTDCLPSSVMVHGLLKNHLQGLWPGQTFWVDRWPAFRVAMVVPIPGQTKNRFGDRLIYVYSTDVTTLGGMLRHPDIIDWSKCLEFEGLPEEAAEEVEAVVKERRLPCNSMGLHVFAAGPDSLVRLSIPEGVTLGPLSLEDVEHVTSTWEFANEDTPEFIQSIVETFPSVSLKNSEGERIGHILLYNYGHMGLLYVEPKYRGQGYGKILISQMAQRALLGGWMPVTTVTPDNVASRVAQNRVGFRQLFPGLLKWLSVNTPQLQTRPLPCSC